MTDLVEVRLPASAAQFLATQISWTPGIAGRLASTVADQRNVWTWLPPETAAKILAAGEELEYRWGGIYSPGDAQGALFEWLVSSLQSDPSVVIVMVDHLASPGDKWIESSPIRLTMVDGAVYAVLDLHSAHEHIVNLALRLFGPPSGTIVVYRTPTPVCEQDRDGSWPVAAISAAEQYWSTIIGCAFDGEIPLMVDRSGPRTA